MSWGQWMVPELTAEADFRLKAQEMELTRVVEHQPEAVASIAGSLLRQTVMYESIIRKATHRIAELEMREALAERKAAPWWVVMLRRRRRQ